MDDWRQRQCERELALERQRECDEWLRRQEREPLEQRRLEEWRNRPGNDLQDPIEERWTWRRWLGLDRREAPAKGQPGPRKPGGGRKPAGDRRR